MIVGAVAESGGVGAAQQVRGQRHVQGDDLGDLADVGVRVSDQTGQPGHRVRQRFGVLRGRGQRVLVHP